MVIPTVLKILDDEAYAEIDALRNHTNEALHKLDDEAHAELNHLRNTTKEALHKVQVALSPFTGHGKSPTAPDHHLHYVNGSSLYNFSAFVGEGAQTAIEPRPRCSHPCRRG